MSDIGADLRYAFRSLRRTPGFTAIALLTLAFGIGANAAIFSVVDGVLLRPLAFQDADALVRITGDLPTAGRNDIGLDALQLADYRSRPDIFLDVAGVYPLNVNLTNVEVPERIEAQLVSPNFFAVLHLDAAQGRVFGPPDGVPGNAPIAVISDALWRRRFGADPAAIGQAIRLDNDLYTIIGVLPASFRYPGATIVSEPDVFVPSGFAGLPFAAPTRGQYRVIGGAIARLAPGMSVDMAAQRTREFGATLAATYPSAYAGQRSWIPRLIPLRDDVVGTVRPALVLLMAAVGAVLLIACANVANLLLARASARHREFAVRASLGATRGRLLRQVLTESVALSLAGAAAGLGALWLLRNALLAVIPSSLPRADSLAVDGRVLGFTVLIAAATGLVFGTWPAFQSSLASPHEALKDAGRSNTGNLARSRVRNVLVAGEMAVALVLLVAAALVGRAFLDFYRQSPGFAADRVLTAQLWMPVPNDPKAGPYFSHDQRVAFLRRSLDALRSVPGVESAAWTSLLPVGRSATSVAFVLDGESPDAASGRQAEQTNVTGGYFSTLQIPLITGRTFSEGDDTRGAPVIVVSESFARQFLPNQAAVGRRVQVGPIGPTQVWSTIVGVVGDVRDKRPGLRPQPQIYRSLLQISNISMSLVVRSAGEPAAAERAVTSAVRSADPELPTYSVRPLTEVMSANVAARRFTLGVVGLFALVALGLAAIGIYGVLAYLVEQRRAEIGVRMALGASSADVLWLVVGRGLWLIGLGEAVGLVASIAVGRVVAGLVAGVASFDLSVFTGIAVLLTAVAVLACGIPAWRATRIDPLRALRQD